MPAALVIQRAKRMRHIVICGLSASIVFFPLYFLMKGHDFGKKVIEY